MSEAIDQVVPFPLPPTSGPPVTAPRALAPPPPAPIPDGVEALQAKVAEQAHVIELAKTRVETLGAEKLAALQQVNELKAQLAAAQARIAALETATPPAPASTLEELVGRVAALEALVAPARVA